MFLLDMEISLENINDAIRKINNIMRPGTDEISLIGWMQRKAREITPYVSHTVEGGKFEEPIYRIYFRLTREGRNSPEQWPMLVEELNNIYQYLRFWFSK